MVDLPAANRDPFRFLRRHEPSLIIAIVLVVALTAIFDSQHNYFNDPWTSCVQIARQASLLGSSRWAPRSSLSRAASTCRPVR